MSKFNDSSYEGESNPLSGWLDYELTQALAGPNAHYDDNCYLDLQSPGGVEFRIFVDCGDFDYFEQAVLPNGDTFNYGHPVLRELEYHWDDNQGELFRKLVQW